MKRIVAATGLFIAAAIVSPPQTSDAQTRYEMDGPCKMRITVPIEIYGDGATPDFAFEIAKNVRDQWAGPTAEDAAQIGAKLGLKLDFYADDTVADSLEKWQAKDGIVNPAINRDGTQELVDNSGQIRGIYDDYVREFKGDPACIQGPCCAIKVMADVKVRSGEPTPGYHPIEIVDDPNFRSYMWGNRVARPGVTNPNPNNADDWQIEPITVKGSGGKWANNAADNAAAHEVGHLMGLMDRYTDLKNAAGKTVGSFQHHGHRHDIMAQSRAFAFEEALAQLFEIAGLECNKELCCPGNVYDGFWQDFGETSSVVGDAIAACNLEHLYNLRRSLRNQRRDMALARGIPVARKIRLAIAIDDRIEDINKAIEECRKRPRTGTPREQVSTGTNYDTTPVSGSNPLSDYGLSTDSSDYCSYEKGSPTIIEDTPGTTPGTTPGSTPGTTPGSTPGSTPGDGPGSTPGTTPGSTPGTTPGSTPGSTPGDTPDWTPPGLFPGWPGLVPRITLPPQPTPEEGDDPRDTPSEDNGDDPRDTDPPEDGDDPRDTTPPSSVFFKVKKTVLEQDGTRTQTEEPQPGRRLKLIVPELQDPALPGGDATKDEDTGAGEDPLQCTTDEEGECEIDDLDVSGIRVGYELDPKWRIGGLGLRYDVEVPVENVKGGIIQGGADTEIPAGGEVTGTFELDGTPYLRLKWDLGYDLNYRLGLDAQYNWHEDLCKDEQPGPWIDADMSRYEGKGQALPRKTLSLSIVEPSNDQ